MTPKEVYDIELTLRRANIHIYPVFVVQDRYEGHIRTTTVVSHRFRFFLLG